MVKGPATSVPLEKITPSSSTRDVPVNISSAVRIHIFRLFPQCLVLCNSRWRWRPPIIVVLWARTSLAIVTDYVASIIPTAILVSSVVLTGSVCARIPIAVPIPVSFAAATTARGGTTVSGAGRRRAATA